MTRKNQLIIGVVAAIVVALAAVWFFFIRDTSPESFDVSSAASAVGDIDVESSTSSTETSAVADSTTTSTTDAAEPGAFARVDGADSPAIPYDGDPSGRWVVDPDFVGTEGQISEAGYRVNEELSTVGEKTVVGRTSLVTGAISIAGTTMTDASFIVDMDSIETDSGSRDNRYRRALETSDFPTSTFTLTQPLDFGSVPDSGETVTVDAVGEMNIHGVTRAVTVTLDAVIVNDTLVVVGSVPVVFTDYDVEKPTAAIVVSLDDEGLIEFQLFFKKVS